MLEANGWHRQLWALLFCYPEPSLPTPSLQWTPEVDFTGCCSLLLVFIDCWSPEISSVNSSQCLSLERLTCPHYSGEQFQIDLVDLWSSCSLRNKSGAGLQERQRSFHFHRACAAVWGCVRWGRVHKEEPWKATLAVGAACMAAQVCPWGTRMTQGNLLEGLLWLFIW